MPQSYLHVENLNISGKEILGCNVCLFLGYDSRAHLHSHIYHLLLDGEPADSCKGKHFDFNLLKKLIFLFNLYVIGRENIYWSFMSQTNRLFMVVSCWPNCSNNNTFSCTYLVMSVYRVDALMYIECSTSVSRCL